MWVRADQRASSVWDDLREHNGRKIIHQRGGGGGRHTHKHYLFSRLQLGSKEVQLVVVQFTSPGAACRGHCEGNKEGSEGETHKASLRLTRTALVGWRQKSVLSFLGHQA